MARNRSAAAAVASEAAAPVPTLPSNSSSSGSSSAAAPPTPFPSHAPPLPPRRLSSHRRPSNSSLRMSLKSITSSKNRHAQQISRLHLMSATGFTQEDEMPVLQRFFKFITLPKFSEYFMSVDHHQIWRRHLAWSLRDGDHLRNAVTGRFASNMVFMSLLLGTEVGVLFSPSKPADTFRAALQNESYGDPNFWAAIVLCISIGLTLSTLVANFTAWAIVGAVSPHNAHAILRSSIGLDAAQLPARLVITSIYCFVAWIVIFLYILLPNVWGIVIAVFPVALIAYIVVLYSSFGRLVIYSRAMQQKEIFKGEEDDHMTPGRLFEELLKRADKEKDKQSPLPLYYRSRTELSQAIRQMRSQESEELVNNGFDSQHASQHVRNILSSSDHIEPEPQMISELLERAENGGIPQSVIEECGDGEGGDTFDSRSSLRSSSSSLRSSGRMGSSGQLGRSGYRRRPPEGAGRGMNRMRGESSRSLMQSSPGGAGMMMTM